MLSFYPHLETRKDNKAQAPQSPIQSFIKTQLKWHKGLEPQTKKQPQMCKSQWKNMIQQDNSSSLKAISTAKDINNSKEEEI
jgi:hypothetical protein